MTLDLEDDQMCYVCGSRNLQGLRLVFEHPKKWQLLATVTFEKHHQGFRDIVHGGMVAMVLDEMMVNLMWKEGIRAVTAELCVRLRKPIKIGEKVYLEGYLEKETKKAFFAVSTAKNQQGETLASAKAICIRV